MFLSCTVKSRVSLCAEHEPKTPSITLKNDPHVILKKVSARSFSMGKRIYRSKLMTHPDRNSVELKLLHRRTNLEGLRIHQE
jgi:hypothetical protein